MIKKYLLHSLPLVLALVLAAVLAAPGAAQEGEEFPVPGGWFYTQASIRPAQFFGYAVTDDAEAPLWTEYRRLGGPEMLGYPVSRRYRGRDGFVYQGFERFILQWRPEQGRAVIANVYEQFSQAGLDDWLLAQGIPRPAPLAESTFENEARQRMSWLTETRFLGFYLLSPLTQQPWDFYEQAWDFYGLPQSGPERLYRVMPGPPALWPFIAQRFQKVALQLWLEEGPGGISRHSVSIVTAGTLARMAGVIPITAALPEPPPTSSPWLIGQPQLAGPPIETGLTSHFALGGAGFMPGETITVTLAPVIDETAQAGATAPTEVTEAGFTRTSVTFSTLARADGSFVIEADVIFGTYRVTARGQSSGVTVTDILNLPQGQPATA